jgi:hypothetical protein
MHIVKLSDSATGVDRGVVLGVCRGRLLEVIPHARLDNRSE